MLQHVVIGDAAVALLVLAVRGPLVFFLLPRFALRPLARLRLLRGLLSFPAPTGGQLRPLGARLRRLACADRVRRGSRPPARARRRARLLRSRRPPRLDAARRSGSAQPPARRPARRLRRRPLPRRPGAGRRADLQRTPLPGVRGARLSTSMPPPQSARSLPSDDGHRDEELAGEKRRVVGKVRKRQVIHHRQVGQAHVLVPELPDVVPVGVVHEVDRLGECLAPGSVASGKACPTFVLTVERIRPARAPARQSPERTHLLARSHPYRASRSQRGSFRSTAARALHLPKKSLQCLRQ